MQLQYMEITKVDLRELDLDPRSPGWEAACAAVTASMAAHGCVVVACNTLGPELRQALFNRAMPELFALPVEAKQRNVPTAAFRGYVGQVPGWDYESMEIQDVSDTKSVHDFSNLLWPQGNPEFCDTIMSSVRKVLELQHMVEKITLDGLGVGEESIAAHFKTLTTPSLRLAHYGAPEMGAVTLPAHTDITVMTGIVQHEVGGLEVQAKDGSWVTIAPETDTITFLAGETFTVLTNGRVPACLHRVKTVSNRDRFSILLNSMTKKGAVVSAMDELVDQENPLMYNPLRTDEYTVFRLSEQGIKSSDPLKDFCGVDKCGSTV